MGCTEGSCKNALDNALSSVQDFKEKAEAERKVRKAARVSMGRRSVARLSGT
jgi:hypothetical protein